MTEEAEYQTEDEEAMEMLGAGYDQPAAVIDPARKVTALKDGGLIEYQVWGWVKISAKFIAHIKKLKGAKLAIWQVIALSIDQEGKCKLPLKKIGTLTGYSHTEVIESIKELEKEGYLIVNRDEKINNYTPVFVARGAEKPKETLVKKLDSTPVYQYESSPQIEKSDSSINRVKRVNAAKAAKPDLLDGELHYNLKPQTIRNAIKEHFRLNVNWETKTARQWMEWAVSENVTPEQIERAAIRWRADKMFNWQPPTLKAIFEKWQMLMEDEKKSSPDKPKRSGRLPQVTI